MAKGWKELNDEFESFLDSIIIESKETELTPEKRQARRDLADGNDFEFCKIYFPGIFNEPFNEMHRSIEKIKTGNHTRSGARKTGKSAFTYVTKGIKRIALGNGGLIGILMRTRDNNGSKERTASLVRLITRNKKLMYDYNINIQQDLKGYYIINNTTMIAISTEIGLRGLINDEFKRFSVVIGDDLYSRSTVESDYDNQKITNFITSEVWGQMEDDGLCIILGNMINEKCPVAQLKLLTPANHFSMPALNENGETCWSESAYHTTEYWINIKNKIPFDVWMGEYMDSPLQKGEIFDIDWIRTISVNRVEIKAALTAIDPSYGTSPDACFKGMITAGITTSGETVILDIYLRKEPYLLVFDYVNNIRSKTANWKTLLFENDFAQWNMASPYYDEWIRTRALHLPIIQFYSKNLKSSFYGSDKDSRIMNLVYPHQTGKLIYGDNLFTLAGAALQGKNNDAKLFLSQYISFGKAKGKLDGLDAEATVFIMLPRWIESGSFKVFNINEFHNQEDSWLHNR
jgi:hypothetical protein